MPQVRLHLKHTTIRALAVLPYSGDWLSLHYNFLLLFLFLLLLLLLQSLQISTPCMFHLWITFWNTESLIHIWWEFLDGVSVHHTVSYKKNTQAQEKYRCTNTPNEGLELMIPVFERYKIAHAVNLIAADFFIIITFKSMASVDSQPGTLTMLSQCDNHNSLTLRTDTGQ